MGARWSRVEYPKAPDGHALEARARGRRWRAWRRTDGQWTLEQREDPQRPKVVASLADARDLAENGRARTRNPQDTPMPNPRKPKIFKPGDLVRETAEFRRSIGQYTSRRIDGVVVGHGTLGPYVAWNDRDDRPVEINAANIEVKKNLSDTERDRAMRSAGSAFGLPIGHATGQDWIFVRRQGHQWDKIPGHPSVDRDIIIVQAERIFDERGEDVVVLDPEGRVTLSLDGAWSAARNRNPGDRPDEDAWSRGHVSLDEGPTFPAMVSSKTWNGWAMPAFTKSVGLRIAKMTDGWDAESGHVVYDADRDAFLWTSASYPGVVEVWTPIKIGGRKYYPIGQGWTWWNDPRADLRERRGRPGRRSNPEQRIAQRIAKGG